MASDAALEQLVKELTGRNEGRNSATAGQEDVSQTEVQARVAARLATLSPVSTSILDLSREDVTPPNARRQVQHKNQSEALGAEVAQHKAVQQLASMFSKLAGQHLGSKWFQHFESWLFARRGSRCRSGPQSVLPVEAASLVAQQELQRKLIATGVSKSLAESICVELNRLPTHLQRAKQQVPASVRVKVAKCVGQQGRIPKIKLACLGVSLEINLTHYNKLRLLHAHTAGDVEHNESVFCQRAMTLLLRYSSLQGTHYRGGGFQAAVHPEVLDELRSRFNVQQECFASPLNCRWPRFCSMFPDTDAPFGSCGDFFQFHPRSGAFEANPPFDKSFVSTMTAHMNKLLSQTDEPLMFAVIIPAWQDARCWEELRDSEFCKHHLLLQAGQHGYCEGAAHNRANQFRVASVASSVFFLQNGAAAEKWPVLMEHVAAIEGAFRPRKECSEDKKSPSSRKRSANDLMQGGEFSRDLVNEQPANAQYRATEIGNVVKKARQSDNSLEGSTGSDAKVAVGEATTLPETPVHVSEAALKHNQNLKKRGKGKKMLSVASHTGKFADEATTQALLAASIAREGDTQVTKHRAGQVDGVPDNNSEEQGVVSFSLSNSQRGKLNKKRDRLAKKARVRR